MKALHNNIKHVKITEKQRAILAVMRNNTLMPHNKSGIVSAILTHYIDVIYL